MIKKIITLFFALVFVVHAFAQYYNGALGLNGTALKTSLHNIIDNHSDQGWPLWNHFYTTDVINLDEVWDIYSDIPGGTPPYMYQLGNNQCGTYSNEGDCYNHEHTWPSTFFNDGTPMKTDLFHVMPTDGYVNNKRSNWPYGKVSSATWTSDNGSKLGSTNSYSGYSDKAFEPIDSFKGDVARNYFYMSTRYQGEDAGWSNWIMANGADLTSDAITLLLNWHHLDPVSQKEIDRNNAIYAIQGNRNPFIDYPQFADCIWGTSDCTSLNAENFSKEQVLTLYPNPTQDQLYINFSSPLNITQYEIINTISSTIQWGSFSNNLTLKNITPGIYFLKLTTAEGNLYRKFIKN